MIETDEQLIKQHYANHSADYRLINPGLEELVWSNGKSNISKVIYLRRKNVLFVTGDLGSAVYVWPQIVDLRWIASLDLAYFASKCEASEEGREYEEWSREKCLKDARYHVEESGKTWNYFEGLGGESAAESYFEWCQWLHDYGYDFFGSDYGELCRLGYVIAYCCRLHLVGLKQALKSLQVEVGG